FCRGKLEDGTSCDCEEFSEPIQTNPNQPLRCAECLHGKSKHPKPHAEQGQAQSASTRATPSASTTTAKQTVLDIFNNTVGVSKDSTTRSPSKKFSASDKPLSKVLLTELESRGCAKQNVIINTDWNHEECTAQLTKILPRPFNFANRTAENKGSERRSQRMAGKPSWVLVGRDGRRLAVVSKERPNGKDLWFHKYGEKSGKKHVAVVVGMYL
ncbi:hypothetical protein BDZ97DRAFT_1618612, partial [Flammula alnicola]